MINKNLCMHMLLIIFLILPVNGHVVLCVVGDVDKNAVSFSNVDRWPGEHTVNGHDWLCMA